MFSSQVRLNKIAIKCICTMIFIVDILRDSKRLWFIYSHTKCFSRKKGGMKCSGIIRGCHIIWRVVKKILATKMKLLFYVPVGKWSIKDTLMLYIFIQQEISSQLQENILCFTRSSHFTIYIRRRDMRFRCMTVESSAKKNRFELHSISLI